MCILSYNLLDIKDKKIKYVFLNRKKFMLFNINAIDYYIELKENIFVQKSSKTYLKIFFSSNLERFASFLNIIYSLNSKILLLKGLGLKAYISKKERLLFLKLGFSHNITIPYSSDIFVAVKNNFIFLQSFNTVKIGNFAAFIRNLKPSDSYKGKGILYKNEIKKLKTVKKK